MSDGRAVRRFDGTQNHDRPLLTPESHDARFPFNGDGGSRGIDFGDPRYIRGELDGLWVRRAMGSGNGESITAGPTDAGNAANFFAPCVKNPNDPDIPIPRGESCRSDPMRGPRSLYHVRSAD